MMYILHPPQVCRILIAQFISLIHCAVQLVGTHRNLFTSLNISQFPTSPTLSVLSSTTPSILLPAVLLRPFHCINFQNRIDVPSKSFIPLLPNSMHQVIIQVNRAGFVNAYDLRPCGKAIHHGGIVSSFLRILS